VVAFARTGEILDMDPTQPGVQTTARPNDDRDSNGVSDIEQVLKGIKVGLNGAIDGGATNYEAALQKATAVFNELKTPSGVGNLIFLSDGQPNEPSSAESEYSDEAASLRSRGYNLRAFGANGAGVTLAPLRVIDPVVGGAKPRPGAAIFNNTNELVAAFAGLRGDSTRYLEPGLAGVTIYIDLDNDGTLDPDEPRAISRADDPATPTVDETGWYSISTGIILPGDTYTIREVVPNGYLHTSLGTLTIPDPANPGATIRNKADGSWILSIPDGQSRQNIDFGNAPGAISGVKWWDKNRNGIRDSSLIVGTDPDVVFVIDVSGSTSSPFGGTIPAQYVPSGNVAGDVNGDGKGNTILDAQIAGFMALNQQLIDQGFGARGRVSIVSFDDTAVSADLDPTAGDQAKLVTNPTADLNNNGIRDIDEVLRRFQDGMSTNYEAALTRADDVFAALGTPAGQGNLVFLSDGVPNVPGGHTDEVAKLKARGVNLRAFGAGDGASLTELQLIDPKAQIFRTTGELLTAFGNPQGGTPSTTTFSEPGMAWVTVYVDLNNNGVKDANEPSAITSPDDPATPNVDERGSYTISGLNAGTYIVREVVPAGYIQTGGGNTRVEGGVVVSDGAWQVTIGGSSPARATNINFGNASAGVISGVKWRDDNPNGIRDGGLIAGDDPDVVFVIDVSGSTNATFVGSVVGDINGDGESNTILDAQLAGFIQLNKRLIAQGYGDSAKVSVVVFGSSAHTANLDPRARSDGGDPDVFQVSPNTDADKDGVKDVEQALTWVNYGTIRDSWLSGRGDVGIGTNYEAALAKALVTINTVGTPAGQANLVFLSDGAPNSAVYSDEVAALKARGVNLRAFGAGGGASLTALQDIDPQAAIFRTTDELITAFGTPQGGSGGSAGSGRFTEPGMAGVTIYLDLNDNGIKDANEPSTVTAADNPATKNVDEAGSYTFTGLAAGKYVVREVVPSGYVLRSTGTLGKFTYSTTYGGQDGPPTNNANNNNDGSWTVYIGWNDYTWQDRYPYRMVYNPVTGLYDWLYSTTDYEGHDFQTEANGIDFGNAPPAEIRGVKWLDRNGDGVRQTYGYDGDYIPSVIFGIDVSGSTWSKYAGCYVGDINYDGKPNTILDAQLYAILALRESLVDGGVGDDATISIVTYGSTAAFVDLDPVTDGIQSSVSPTADRNRNGVSDLVEAVQGILEGSSGAVGVGTDFEAALQLIQQDNARRYGTPPSTLPPLRQLLFFSDGAPTEGGDIADEVTALVAYNVIPKAFGVGSTASLTELKKISASAAVYARCSDLSNAIDYYYAAMLPEPGLPGVTVYVDANDNGKLDAGEKWAVTRKDDPSTPLDEAGTYAIGNVPNGTWKVREVAPDGYIQTFPSTNGGAHSVTISAASLVRNIDFGNQADPLAPVVTLPWYDSVVYETNFQYSDFDVFATVDDTSSETFAGGNLTVSVVSGDASAIALNIADEDGGVAWIGVDGTKVLFHGNVIGTFAGGVGTPLVVSFNALATPRAAQALIRSIFLTGTGKGAVGMRTVKVSVTDDTKRTSIAQFKDVEIRAITPPSLISGLAATGGNGRATLSWTAPADYGGSAITNYEIMYADQTAGKWSSYKPVTRSASTATTATVTGLTNDKPHVFVVRAVNAKGAGQWVTLAKLVTPTSVAPGSIGTLTAAPGDRQVTLTWAAPTDNGGAAITNYEVMVAEQTAGNWSAYKPVTRAASAATTATITGLTNAKPHLFVVRAVNAKGVGPWQTLPSPTTPAAAPGAIRTLTATGGNGRVTLTWAAPLSNGGSPITNYSIMYADQTAGIWSAYKPVTRAASTATTATVTGLTNDKPHVFVVRAETAAGVGTWVTLSPVVTPTGVAPGAISALKATGGNTKATLTWTAPADNGGSPITNYEIMVADRTSGVWSAYKPVTRPASTATTAVVTGLTNGKEHLFVVRAVNAKGVSGWTTLSAAVTPRTTPPGLVTGLKATPGSKRVTLSWTAPADNGGSAITNYEIMYAEQTAGLWSAYKPVTRAASTATTATVTGLTAGKAHIFVVRAVTALGAGQWETLSPTVTPLA
jgi:Mg-chelatase subunit ChlD